MGNQRGAGGKFVTEWVAKGQKFAPRGFYYDAGMGAFIWRPAGGALGDDGPQYAVYGKVGFSRGAWSAYRWGVDGQGPIPYPDDDDSGRGVHPWGGFNAAVKHWESHKNNGGA